MRVFPWSNADHRVRKRLIAILESSDVDCNGELKDDTSLIKSGKLDSLGLFNLALFIESEIGRELDVASFDFSHEWDTVAGILGFIGQHRAGGKRYCEYARSH